MTTRVLTAARVLTGSGALLQPGTVVIDEQHIAWIGAPEHLPAEWNHPGIDGADLPEATILAGLIDAHVHLSFGGDPRPPAAVQATTRYQVAATIRAARAQLLRAGVTTVRDLGAPRYIDIDTLTAAPTPGPRVLTATIPLTTEGGHCHGLGGVVSTSSDIARLVTANAQRGADWIKAMVTGGFTTGARSSPYTAQFTDAQLARIVSVAAEHGLPVAAHAHGSAGIRQAVAAGVDSIEHCTWMTPDGFDLDHGLVREIADRRIMVCPTINHHARTATGRLPWPIRRDHLRVMLEAGVQLIPGSDSGIPQTPHDHYALSLAVYTDLDLTPTEVIDMASRRAAEALRLGEVTGTLAAGQTADLIAVTGDPTRDLGVLTTPMLVMTAGHLHRLDATTDAEEDTCA